MLAELHIRNYALIDDLKVEFGPGLNVFTGETGAGKSIIIGALSLVLGERPDPTMIRTGAENIQVEARFEDAKSTVHECEELGIESADDTLILRRRAARSGKSNTYANDSPITVNALRRLGDRLVDLHGQHQHQVLLKSEMHSEILDAYAQLTDERCSFAKNRDKLIATEKELTELQKELSERREHRKLTEYQLKELSEANVEPGEVNDRKKEKSLLESAERRYTLARELSELLSEKEGSITELLSVAAKKLEELGRIDRSLKDRLQTVSNVQNALDDLWRELVSYREKIQFSPGRLEEINSRLFYIERLEKKYRVPADQLPGLKSRLKQELDSIELDESKCDEIKQNIKKQKRELLKHAEFLSRKRKSAKLKLEAKLRSELAALGLAKAKLVIDITRPDKIEDLRLKIWNYGIDKVEFLFTANPGENLRPLRKVASGGELSRIMLALKNSLTKVKLVPTMVFDEIDVGIGGRVAEAVGKRLARLGRDQQIVCITHLAQIAKYANSHFLVTKSTLRGRTFTSLKRLEGEKRVKELARMVAGTAVTKTGLAHAREMLKNAEPYAK